MIFTVEKSIKDLGDKVTAEDKAKLEEEIKLAKTELETNDKEKMDSAFEKLSSVSQEVFAKIYQQASQNGEAPNGENPSDTEFHQG
jgi:molecular chaperone DnaK